MRKHQIQDICFKTVVWNRPISQEEVWAVLFHLASSSPRGAAIWEVRGCNGKVIHLLGADKLYIDRIEEIFLAHGDVNFYEADAVEVRKPITVAGQLNISHPVLSLNTDLSQAVVRAGLAALAQDKSGREVVLQVVLGRSFAPVPLPIDFQDPHASWLQILCGSINKASSEARKTAREKAEQHRFQAAIRIGVSGDNSNITHLHGIVSALRTLESAGVRIKVRSLNPQHLNIAHVPWSFPAQLSVKELTPFLLLPMGEEDFPGTPDLHPRLVLPPPWYRSPTNRQNDRSFALSMEAVNPKKLSISPKDSLEHAIVIGPTGSGKSTVLQHLILADIKAGRSVLVIDPKAEHDILARLPENRASDVVIIDPSSPRPVGLNPLAFKEFGNPALLADTILSVMKEIFSDSWGVRIADILNAALLTLVEIEDATLLWLSPLLTDEKFRRKITGNVKDKIGLQPFWNQFESLSEAQRRLQVEPLLNKLRQFLLRPRLRNVLGQAHPKFNLAELFTSKKIVLVPLNKGVIGGESARLLGSLIVGLTWTLALSRTKLPPERRYLVSMYVDELQDYISSVSADFSDALAQARGLGLGLTLAHQYRDQLPLEIRSGIDANCRNKIVFGLSSKDAKDMAAMAPELSAEDFMLLPRYQIYTSFQNGGRSTGWIQGKTLPPEPAIRESTDLYTLSMETYGTSPEEVEADYFKAIQNGSTKEEENSNTSIGRRKRL